jgi:hypothetical protein
VLGLEKSCRTFCDILYVPLITKAPVIQRLASLDEVRCAVACELKGVPWSWCDGHMAAASSRETKGRGMRHIKWVILGRRTRRGELTG